MQAKQAHVDDGSKLLRRVNSQDIVYHFIMRKREFTVLGLEVYESDVYICV